MDYGGSCYRREKDVRDKKKKEDVNLYVQRNSGPNSKARRVFEIQPKERTVSTRISAVTFREKQKIKQCV